MNEMINLMKKHTSVRHFTDEKIPEATMKAMIEAGLQASNWKNFQSYSIIDVANADLRQALFDAVPQRPFLTASHILVFVGDMKRAETAVQLHQEDFVPQGTEGLLISSVDASLAAQNIMVGAESLGYGGVYIGLIRDASEKVSDILKLPEFTYPIFALALGVPDPAKNNKVKPRLPYEAMVFKDAYQVQGSAVIRTYDKVQDDFAGPRRLNKWSERQVQQFGQAQNPSSTQNLQAKKLL